MLSTIRHDATYLPTKFVPNSYVVRQVEKIAGLCQAYEPRHPYRPTEVTNVSGLTASPSQVDISDDHHQPSVSTGFFVIAGACRLVCDPPTIEPL